MKRINSRRRWRMRYKTNSAAIKPKKVAIDVKLAKKLIIDMRLVIRITKAII